MDIVTGNVRNEEFEGRYATSVASAGEVTPGVLRGLGRTAIVASAEVFADALEAGPFAARGVHPVLLSAPDALPTNVASYLDDAGISHVVVMGGTAALSADVETAIEGLGVGVTRLAGKTRYGTAVKAAQLVTGRCSTADGETCFAASTVGLARARVPFDTNGDNVPDSREFAGSHRYNTAVALAERFAADEGSISTVILASGES
ncbi:MAG: cell wall-binding repeat-containing protein, partial [Acidimicrobiaceae bacterium]|nr:cell wall-binding repeat-containing protein [Acidimicrobiaceae bacterium]